MEWLLINAEANVEVDLTSLDALDRAAPRARRRGVVLALARVKQDLLDDLDAAGLVDAIGTDRMYPTLPTAVAAYLAWHEEQHGRPHPAEPPTCHPCPPTPDVSPEAPRCRPVPRTQPAGRRPLR